MTAMEIRFFTLTTPNLRLWINIYLSVMSPIHRPQTAMHYNEAWDFLDQLQFFKIKLGLDSMNRFLARLDNPQAYVPFLHIGGTNGKGSVGATLHSILSTAGYKVGLYTSPHLSSVRERFKINNHYISRHDFSRQMEQIQNVLGQNQITYFECTTTLAMLWFAQENVDLAILEVGMGGRLDATNVITPLVSVITNVSMDHEQYLGTTLEEVAFEKAGIIKPKVPVVSGVADDISRSVVVKQCREQGSPLYLSGRDFFGTYEDSDKNTWQYTGPSGCIYNNLPLAMQGSYQLSNASLALTTIQLLQDRFPVSAQDICNGLSRTRWPGRLEHVTLHPQNTTSGKPQHYLLDGAHNPAGVDALYLALSEDFNYKRLIMIWGAMADKDLHATLQVITPLVDSLILTRPESERSASPEELQTIIGDPAAAPETYLTQTVEEALSKAASLAEEDDLICIAGSLYLVGEARQLLLGGLVKDG